MSILRHDCPRHGKYYHLPNEQHCPACVALRAHGKYRAGMEYAASLFDGLTFSPFKHPGDIIREELSKPTVTRS
jgi:hypothetical protein